jgi:hypothetical protein
MVALAAHLERQQNGRSFFRDLATDRINSGRAGEWSTLAAGPDERLSPVDQPAWAHANNPVPSRGFGAEYAHIELSGLGSARPVVMEEVVLGTMAGCPSKGSVLQAHVRSPFL